MADLHARIDHRESADDRSERRVGAQLSPLGLPRWVATGDLRRDPGLIVAGLASRPRITVYWDGVPR
jgi:hypothetical protein